MSEPINVLFLCTHNSARSIVAEVLLNALGEGRFKAFSAGSSPREGGSPNPLGLAVLREHGFDTEGVSSKSWDVFAQSNAPKMDLIITVCDNAAGETCPYWPGNPASAHWGYPDPSAGSGSDDEKREAFRQTLHAMRRRLQALVDLPLEKLSAVNLRQSAKELASV
ncbi:arsenate reductase ArsC [Variovorax sp. PCZ-1]|uniref:arsenate reductase ArsC n=1 Tax=Variovorax sp. PCZ-1 TaxID=2835533 RepID=UPI001BD19C12|nr:arsenate reductase ArsC [Variovorax sp. PCZ-1]MBS7806696.1 arsenate reductase ArsC [Variovorax sp. PCZ-1]